MAADEQLSLFDADPLRTLPPPAEPDRTPGERRRARQAAAIAVGRHPLSLHAAQRLRLHDDAQRALTVTAGPSCGGCRFRQRVNTGHARSYPKCLWPDPQAYGKWPRETSGIGSDVLASWPACRDFEPATEEVSADGADA